MDGVRGAIMDDEPKLFVFAPASGRCCLLVVPGFTVLLEPSGASDASNRLLDKMAKIDALVAGGPASLQRLVQCVRHSGAAASPGAVGDGATTGGLRTGVMASLPKEVIDGTEESPFRDNLNAVTEAIKQRRMHFECFAIKSCKTLSSKWGVGQLHMYVLAAPGDEHKKKLWTAAAAGQGQVDKVMAEGDLASSLNTAVLLIWRPANKSERVVRLLHVSGDRHSCVKPSVLLEAMKGLDADVKKCLAMPTCTGETLAKQAEAKEAAKVTSKAPGAGASKLGAAATKPKAAAAATEKPLRTTRAPVTKSSPSATPSAAASRAPAAAPRTTPGAARARPAPMATKAAAKPTTTAAKPSPSGSTATRPTASATRTAPRAPPVGSAAAKPPKTAPPKTRATPTDKAKPAAATSKTLAAKGKPIVAPAAAAKKKPAAAPGKKDLIKVKKEVVEEEEEKPVEKSIVKTAVEATPIKQEPREPATIYESDEYLHSAMPSDMMPPAAMPRDSHEAAERMLMDDMGLGNLLPEPAAAAAAGGDAQRPFEEVEDDAPRHNDSVDERHVAAVPQFSPVPMDTLRGASSERMDEMLNEIIHGSPVAPEAQNFENIEDKRDSSSGDILASLVPPAIAGVEIRNEMIHLQATEATAENLPAPDEIQISTPVASEPPAVSDTPKSPFDDSLLEGVQSPLSNVPPADAVATAEIGHTFELDKSPAFDGAARSPPASHQLQSPVSFDTAAAIGHSAVELQASPAADLQSPVFAAQISSPVEQSEAPVSPAAAPSPIEHQVPPMSPAELHSPAAQQAPPMSPIGEVLGTVEQHVQPMSPEQDHSPVERDMPPMSPDQVGSPVEQQHVTPMTSEQVQSPVERRMPPMSPSQVDSPVEQQHVPPMTPEEVHSPVERHMPPGQVDSPIEQHMPPMSPEQIHSPFERHMPPMSPSQDDSLVEHQVPPMSPDHDRSPTEQHMPPMAPAAQHVPPESPTGVDSPVEQHVPPMSPKQVNSPTEQRMPPMSPERLNSPVERHAVQELDSPAAQHIPPMSPDSMDNRLQVDNGHLPVDFAVQDKLSPASQHDAAAISPAAEPNVPDVVENVQPGFEDQAYQLGIDGGAERAEISVEHAAVADNPLAALLPEYTPKDKSSSPINMSLDEIGPFAAGLINSIVTAPKSFDGAKSSEGNNFDDNFNAPPANQHQDQDIAASFAHFRSGAATAPSNGAAGANYSFASSAGMSGATATSDRDCVQGNVNETDGDDVNRNLGSQLVNESGSSEDALANQLSASLHFGDTSCAAKTNGANNQNQSVRAFDFNSNNGNGIAGSQQQSNVDGQFVNGGGSDEANVNRLKQEWGEPLGLPVSTQRPPARPTASSGTTKAGTSKVADKTSPYYVDAFVFPGDNEQFGQASLFHSLRAHHYVLAADASAGPHSDVLQALMEAKRRWNRPEMHTRLVATHDGPELQAFAVANLQQLQELCMDVCPPAESCTLQCGEVECAAQRITFE